MNNKKIVAGLLALTFAFGGAALPNTVVNNSVVASAATQTAEVLTYGDYDYTILKDGTVEIARYNGSDAEVVIPGEIDGVAVTSVGKKAFSGNSNITIVSIPEGIKTIGEHAFLSCSNLENINLPDGLEKIDTEAFYKCTKLVSISMPDSLKSLGVQAFEDCSALADVKLSANLTYLPNVFRYCNSIETLEIPEGVKSIKSLSSLGNLKSVSLPESLTRLGNGCFYNCSKLKELTVSANVISIDEGGWTFQNNDKDFVLNCYNASAAEKYALANGVNFNVLDAKEKTEYPELNSARFNSQFVQFRLNWAPVEGAEQYGVAVKLAGKWKVQAYTDKTNFTSPKLKKYSTYEVVICAKVNGKWDISNLDKRSFKVAVR